MISFSVSDDVCDLKVERPGIGSEMTAKERGSLEENEERDLEEVEAGNGEKGQEDEPEKKEVKETADEEEERRGADEEDELEVLRSQVVQLLLELEETREVSQRHEESYNELQGAYANKSCF